MGPIPLCGTPLYLCEIIGVFATVLQYRSLIAIGLFAVTVAAQIMRGRMEENILARAFAEFASYQARTPFLIPRDSIRFLSAFATDPSLRWRFAIVVASAIAVSTLALTVPCWMS